MNLSTTDTIEVFQRCMTCLGQKVITDDAGNTSECQACKGTGAVSVRVMLRDVVNFIGEEIARQVRLQGGGRR